jgi:light-regulated signal transduction histidine kinase (bacteriophytochrome)
MSMSEDFEELLARCAEEEIRVPGTIQPHGTLLGVEPESELIHYAGANGPAYLGREADRLLGERAPAVLGTERWNRIARLMAGSRAGEVFAGEDPFETEVWIGAHEQNGYGIIEIEAHREDPMDPGRLPEMQEELLNVSGVEELLSQGVKHLREITRFEHVMLYRFRPNWAGEVVAEVTGEQLPAYQGHRFPASDIPKQARELYRQNRFRLIPNANYDPVPVISEQEDPLDMSFALLRSVSPVHLRYLANMGVRASCSVSVLPEEELWGLFACHHPEPKRIAPARRYAASLYGRQFSVHLNLHLDRRRQEYLRVHRSDMRIPQGAVSENRALPAQLEAHGDQVGELTQAGGWAARILGETASAGHAPSAEEIRCLFEWLDDQEIEKIWWTHHLAWIMHK